MQDLYRKTRHWIQVIAWIVAIVVTSLIFESFIQYQNRPGVYLTQVQSNSVKQVVIHGNYKHSFQFRGYINGQPVTFLFDTGASQVSIPAHLANQLNLKPGRSGRAFTANGYIAIHYTNIKSLKIGNIELKNVLGHINPGIKRNIVLLGMSALKHLEIVQKNNILILRQHSHQPNIAVINE